MERVDADLVPFAQNNPSGYRFAFGTDTATDDINANYNDNIKKGWGTTPNEFPEVEDFNAFAYTSGYLLAYLYQDGISEWNDKQKYYVHSITKVNGVLYESLTGTEETPNVNNNPTLAGSLSWALFLPDRIGMIEYAYIAKPYHIVAFGGEFNRADYPKLWAYLQANPSLVKTQAQWTTESTTNGGICGFYSDGDGTTTFRVPNLDKAFLRPDSRGVGSHQGDAIRNITGSSAPFYNAGGSFGIGALGSGSYGNSPAKIGVIGGDPGDTRSIDFDASLVVPTADENRPKNIAVLPLIVAK